MKLGSKLEPGKYEITFFDKDSRAVIHAATINLKTEKRSFSFKRELLVDFFDKDGMLDYPMGRFGVFHLIEVIIVRHNN